MLDHKDASAVAMHSIAPYYYDDMHPFIDSPFSRDIISRRARSDGKPATRPADGGPRRAMLKDGIRIWSESHSFFGSANLVYLGGGSGVRKNTGAR